VWTRISALFPTLMDTLALTVENRAQVACNTCDDYNATLPDFGQHFQVLPPLQPAGITSPAAFVASLSFGQAEALYSGLQNGLRRTKPAKPEPHHDPYHSYECRGPVVLTSRLAVGNFLLVQVAGSEVSMGESRGAEFLRCVPPVLRLSRQGTPTVHHTADDTEWHLRTVWMHEGDLGGGGHYRARVFLKGVWWNLDSGVGTRLTGVASDIEPGHRPVAMMYQRSVPPSSDWGVSLYNEVKFDNVLKASSGVVPSQQRANVWFTEWTQCKCCLCMCIVCAVCCVFMYMCMCCCEYMMYIMCYLVIPIYIAHMLCFCSRANIQSHDGPTAGFYPRRGRPVCQIVGNDCVTVVVC
jgi:hypothetical protein